MRTKQAKRFIGRGKKVAVSDSTIPRSLNTYHLQPLRSYLKTIYTKARHNGKCKVDVYGKKFKLACVDGSLWFLMWCKNLTGGVYPFVFIFLTI